MASLVKQSRTRFPRRAAEGKRHTDGAGSAASAGRMWVSKEVLVRFREFRLVWGRGDVRVLWVLGPGPSGIC